MLPFACQKPILGSQEKDTTIWAKYPFKGGQVAAYRRFISQAADILKKENSHKNSNFRLPLKQGKIWAGRSDSLQGKGLKPDFCLGGHAPPVHPSLCTSRLYTPLFMQSHLMHSPCPVQPISCTARPCMPVLYMYPYCSWIPLPTHPTTLYLPPCSSPLPGAEGGYSLHSLPSAWCMSIQGHMQVPPLPALRAHVWDLRVYLFDVR